jgi:hypothetical protein
VPKTKNTHTGTQITDRQLNLFISSAKVATDRHDCIFYFFFILIFLGAGFVACMDLDWQVPSTYLPWLFLFAVNLVVIVVFPD